MPRSAGSAALAPVPFGSQSRRDTEVPALLYSLFASAKLVGVEPKAYLLRALHAALAVPGTATLLLPVNDTVA